jgi:serine phosphatase RsbU (regulator of sigma subunit)
MYVQLRRLSYLIFVVLASALFASLGVFLAWDVGFLWFTLFLALAFLMLTFLVDSAADWVDRHLYQRYFMRKDTRFLVGFLKKLRICFTTNELISSIQKELEEKADCAVLYVNMKNRYSIYNSPARVTSDPETFRVIVRQFAEWKDGVYLFDEEYGLTHVPRRSRGFFFVYGEAHLYVFARFARLFESSVYDELYHEFRAYLDREKTIERMYVISALSKEWELVAETQKSFLPKVMPTLEGLEVASYYRPLVNVSGDYYDILPIDEKRTLLVLGDVSGKGLGAALIMGIIVNTIKISDNKTKLDELVRSIDSAIKAMAFEDKYTVLFLGIVDTERQSLRYVNASMSEPLIVSQSPAGPVTKSLPSNCSLVGIIELDEVRVDELSLHPDDVILIASDGVTEVTNKEGVQLSENKVYLQTIKSLSEESSPEEMVDSLADLVLTYTGEKKLRDDVTMLIARVK